MSLSPLPLLVVSSSRSVLSVRSPLPFPTPFCLPCIYPFSTSPASAPQTIGSKDAHSPPGAEDAGFADLRLSSDACRSGEAKDLHQGMARSFQRVDQGTEDGSFHRTFRCPLSSLPTSHNPSLLVCVRGVSRTVELLANNCMCECAGSQLGGLQGKGSRQRCTFSLSPYFLRQSRPARAHATSRKDAELDSLRLFTNISPCNPSSNSKFVLHQTRLFFRSLIVSSSGFLECGASG